MSGYELTYKALCIRVLLYKPAHGLDERLVNRALDAILHAEQHRVHLRCNFPFVIYNFRIFRDGSITGISFRNQGSLAEVWDRS